jgi:hypothetical protein
MEGEALEDFVDGAVASAGEEDVGLDLGGLVAGGVWALGGDGLGFEGVGAEGGGDAFDEGGAVVVAAGVGL